MRAQSAPSPSVNPIRPDPFEFLIGLSVCLGDTHSLTTIWNELEGCNFASRFDFTNYEANLFRSKMLTLSGSGEG